MNCRGGWGIGSYNRSEMGMRGGWVGGSRNEYGGCLRVSSFASFSSVIETTCCLDLVCEIETGRLTLLPEEGDDWLLTLQTSDHVTEQTFIMCKILEYSFTCANVLRFLPISWWNLVIYLSLKDLGNSRIVSSMSIWHTCEFQIVDQILYHLKLNMACAVEYILLLTFAKYI